MAGNTTYLDNKFLDAAFGNTPVAPASPLYVGLSSTNILDDGSGRTEPVGGNYARVGVGNNTDAWPSASAGVKLNGTQIAFPTASATWTVNYFFIADASTSGNIYVRGSVSPAQTVSTSQQLRFNIGDMSISLS